MVFRCYASQIDGFNHLSAPDMFRVWHDEYVLWSMASTLTVKVHPVVYLTIVDAYERRSNKPGANDKALGTLLGFYEKNAIQVGCNTRFDFRFGNRNLD
ncbi:unnamed protein product [Toxocara canis]|uniref:Thioesterase n=1 Tax=Toxocara canis TaxID=6265 RepID=A0A183VE46_TOXCA|nr:unnamed protein product [Toxocara canis]